MQDSPSGLPPVSDSDPAAPPPAATLTERALAIPRSKVVTWGLLSCVVLGVGSIAPWSTAILLGYTESAGGLNGGGWVTLVTAIFGAVAITEPSWLNRVEWAARRRLGIWFGLLLTSVVVCLLNFSDTQSNGLAGVVHPGWGLDVSLGAAVVGSAVAWILRLQARQFP